MAEIFYSDLHYKLNDDSAGNVTIVKNAESVRQSVKMILATFPGERWMNPEFGSRIRTLLFEPIDDITAEFIKVEIVDAVSRWENRITIKNIDVSPDYDKNIYKIRFDFNIIEIDVNAEFEGKLKVVI